MTPKEKAKELFYKFHNIPSLALTCVDQIIWQNNIWIDKIGIGSNNYWNEVKKEINKL